ncbi:MAG: nucleotidyltransferase domain-containing protein [Candidatus Omnitrophica bacterium]|nr:nucleotidyltransferase domain-containing protein [Candidatus Omnitrophota bacterium]
MVSKELKTKILKSLAAVDYDKVILFGSRARGDQTRYSDFDLLLILSGHISITEKIRLATLLRKKFAGDLIDADVVVKDKDDIEYLKDKPGSIVRNALGEGVVL